MAKEPTVTETDTGYDVEIDGVTVGVHSEQASTPEQAIEVAKKAAADYNEMLKERP